MQDVNEIGTSVEENVTRRWKPKFAIHPGYVVSKNDGDIHYINAWELARLYRLKNDEYIIWDARAEKVFDRHELIHLYPNYNGRYGRPNELGHND